MNGLPFGAPKTPKEKGVVVTSSRSQVLRYTVLGCVALAVLGAGWRVSISPVISPTPSFAPILTYSTYEGAIWQIDADGHREGVLAPDGLQKPYLTWSPDHSQLAYVVQEFAAPDTTRAQSLYLLNAKGGGPRKLAGPFHQLDFVRWSDAQHIEMQATDLSTHRDQQANESPRLLLTIDTQTSLLSYLGVVTRELPTGNEAGQPLSERYVSPDGKWSIAPRVDEADRVFDLLDAAGKDLGTIYRQPSNAQVLYRFWSPDSRWLLYRRPVLDTVRPDLYVGDTVFGDLLVYDPLTLSSRRLTSFEGTGAGGLSIGFYTSAQWSPDSKWLLFRAFVAPTSHGLCTANLEQASTRCFDARPKSGDLVWDRRSEFVAFVGQVAEPTDLYVIDVRKGGLRNLTNNGDSETEDWITGY